MNDQYTREQARELEGIWHSEKYGHHRHAPIGTVRCFRCHKETLGVPVRRFSLHEFMGRDEDITDLACEACSQQVEECLVCHRVDIFPAELCIRCSMQKCPKCGAWGSFPTEDTPCVPCEEDQYDTDYEGRRYDRAD